ncbi:Crp/Fnr family transcriptional regulator [Epilithonimonas zeae]|uniref:Transcriptional regulator, Crp/Fnr family n=1 Tax=Epilithonimonas zeae TaxID=1416779 RepID=A0A1N6FV97_9FLAO|nr:Crp/Fnr family transcriptional regulator [Epilithonimonas zeae]SIN99101.1 transcriptional regulator, Crp/Fnr family [Epilithonimonas zeae]
MVIDQCILESRGAVIVEYGINDLIFLEGDILKYYYQIIEGKVKLNNYTDDGKEILQNNIDEGMSFGEYLLFLENARSPVNAVALTSCKISKLPKASFLGLIEEFPNLGLDINHSISEHIHFRNIIGKSAAQRSSHKLIALLDHLKSKQPNTEPFSFMVPLTRQEMANLTGLCVETTIKMIKKMEKENLLKIVNRKIYY